MIMPAQRGVSHGLGVPSGWSIRPLRDDVTLLSGRHILAQHVNTEGIGIAYLTGPADFPDGHIQQTKFTTRLGTLCEPGDILVTVKGSGSGSLTQADDEYCISRRLMAVRPKQWNTSFVLYSLLQNGTQIRAAVTGLIPGLSRKDILNQPLPIPDDRLEQDAIAEALSNVDGLIAALDSLIAKKRAIKQAAMQQLLTGKTRLPGFTGEWPKFYMGELGTFSKGRGIKRDDIIDEGVPCIRYGELYTRYRNYIVTPLARISKATAATALPIKCGDLLFAGSGETAEEIGQCAAYLGSEIAYAGGDIIVLTPQGQNSMYLGHLMNHPRIASQKERLGQGDAVVHINARHLAQVEMIIPPVEEQTAIAKILGDMDAEIHTLERRRDKTIQIKKGMMQQLLTGTVRLVNYVDVNG